MKIWIVTIGESLPIIDGENVRLHRAGILAEYLQKKGHNVTWWTSSFNHFSREQRCYKDTDLKISNNYLIKILYAKGYKKNVSLQRIVNHYKIAYKFKKLIQKETVPDIIISSMPTIELSLFAAQFGKKNKVPVVLDIRDLWPDIFVELVPKFLKPFLKAALFPMYKNLRSACKDAFSLTGNSPYFVKWGIDYAERKQNHFDKDFPFGYPEKKIEEKALIDAEKFWNDYGINKQNKDFIICFFGALGKQINIEIIIETAKKIYNHNKKIKFIICGLGENLKKYKLLSKGLENIIFPGWIDRASISKLMELSVIGLAPYYNSYDFLNSLPNKPIEYMSGGLAIASSLKGYLQKIIESNNCGFVYENSDELTSILLDLYNRPEKLNIMKANSLKLFKEKYTADNVYSDMVEHLGRIVKYENV